MNLSLSLLLAFADQVSAGPQTGRRDLSVNGGAMKYAAWLEVAEDDGAQKVNMFRWRPLAGYRE